MVTLSLLYQTLKSVSYNIDIPEGCAIELENSYVFNVDYDENNSRCIAKLEHKTQDTKDPARFTAEIHLVGRYECSGILTEEDKKTAHIQAYIQLFPYVQSFISYLTTSSGLPPLFVSRDLLETHIEDVDIQSETK